MLRKEAQTLRALIAGVPKVTFVRATLSTAEPKLAFSPRENAAAASGISTGELAMSINALLSGQTAGMVLEGNRQIPVRVQLADRFRDDIADLTTLPLLANNRNGVPLQELGEWRLQPTASAIDRRQGERLSTVQAFLQPFTLPDTVMRDIRKVLEDTGYQPPPGYRLSIGGVAEESAESMGNIVSVFIFFALAMTAVVILSLNSFRQAGLIGTVAILSFGLALLGLRIFDYPFGYMALIGALGMMGLAINGAIIVLSALKASAATNEGDTEAVVSVVMDASRHIVSTTLTTIGGFVPLIVNGGKFWPPVGNRHCWRCGGLRRNRTVSDSGQLRGDTAQEGPQKGSNTSSRCSLNAMLIQLGCKDVTTDVVSQEGPVSVKASQRDKKINNLRGSDRPKSSFDSSLGYQSFGLAKLPN